MRFAMLNGERIFPTPTKQGYCPLCNEELVAKCGKIKIWHWSHKSLKNCDSWAEGESEWHLNWKGKFPAEMQEVIVIKNEKKHIADVKCSKGLVIELQNSSISSEEIQERENFYGEMVWVLNGAKFAQNLILRKKDNYYSFRWKWFPKTWSFAKKNVYIDMQALADYHLAFTRNKNEDFNNSYAEELKRHHYEMFKELNGKLFLIRKIYTDGRVGGWGKLMDREEMIGHWRRNA